MTTWQKLSSGRGFRNLDISTKKDLNNGVVREFIEKGNPREAHWRLSCMTEDISKDSRIFFEDFKEEVRELAEKTPIQIIR